MIGAIFDVIEHDMCEFIVFTGLRSAIVDFDQNLLF